MLENDSRSLVSGAAGLVLVFLLTLPSLASAASHLRESKPKSKSKSNIYEDKDGIATENSVTEYSARIPKIFLSVFATFGLGTSIALAVLDTLARSDALESWLNFAQWVRTFT
jgi:hypothetical protein